MSNITIGPNSVTTSSFTNNFFPQNQSNSNTGTVTNPGRTVEEAGSFGRNETITLTNHNLLIIDKPMQFHGTIDSFPNAEALGTSNRVFKFDSISIPSIGSPAFPHTADTFGHADFVNHVLDVFSLQDKLLASLRLPDTNLVAIQQSAPGILLNSDYSPDEGSVIVMNHNML